jgi:hypothetical protein
MVDTEKPGQTYICTRLTPSNAVNKRGAAVQSTEFDELVEALKELASQADDYDDDKGVYPILVSDDGLVFRHAAAALAAERDRADHYLQVAAELQQRIVDAPHGRGCQQMEQATFVGRPDFCNCWKSEATA